LKDSPRSGSLRLEIAAIRWRISAKPWEFDMQERTVSVQKNIVFGENGLLRINRLAEFSRLRFRCRPPSCNSKRTRPQ